MLRMRLSHIFERLLLQEILKMGKSRTGRPAKLGDEEALKCVFKVLRTGMQWREVDASVSFVTVFRRFQTWSKNNVFQNAYKRTIEVYRKLIPSKYYCIDSSYVKNKYGQQCVGKNHTDRGRKALKLSLITDQNGIAFSVTTDPGNRPDVTLLLSSLEGMLLNVESLPLYADRGYDSRKNRRICSMHGLQDRIFRRKTKTVRRTNAKRIVVEHSFSWLDKYRRLLMFYEQTPAPFTSFVFLALGHQLCSRFMHDEPSLFFTSQSDANRMTNRL